ncbi:MAG TPA: UDP-3-O-(3-hydroxymyristoyl)glucosamine N-acyltransferase [Armatimonadota bacterium]|nr:UDP-3-O-(3-hydroxymyristoyl)glucosamine N-acyltransferase [Armatimonadota bacterium]HOS42263.1 UDP-3-O-(3-hydroxymyristoyl)glucosamine N-acyltransferase [Armatimonadota bacterium]
MQITLGELTARVGGALVGGDADLPITGAAGYDTVAAGEVTYVTDAARLPAAEASPAAAILAPAGVTSPKPLILVDDPRAAFGRALALFDWRRAPEPGIHPLAHVAASAVVHPTAAIGAHAAVGADSVIGEGAVLHPHAVVGYGVRIGAETVLHAAVTIYPHCTLGARVIVHAGAVVGADGLGFVPAADGWQKLPHLGTVVIEDDVEIGANVTIDRATSGATVIGRGTKIDNLVHIAHNVTIGAHCMIVAQVGIAGSATLADGVIIAGQAGVADHKHIGAGARIAVRAGITRDVPAGATYSGHPAQPHADQLKMEAALRRLPELAEKVKALEQRLAALDAERDGA